MKEIAQRLKICFSMFINVRTGLLCCAFMCCWITGCCSYPRSGAPSAVDRYIAKHPADYRDFVYLLPIKLDTYQVLLANQLGVADRISIRLKKKFPNNAEIQEFADSAFKEEEERSLKESQRYTGLEKAAAPNGAVCQYLWNDGKTQEMGILILKDGDIIEREPWITDYLTEKPR